jgi:hypothetical protein
MRIYKCGALLGVAMIAAASQAIIIITPGPGNFPNDENILFNRQGRLSMGMRVEGESNQTHFVVDFYDAGETLHTPSGGQARVEAVDGGMTDMALRLQQPGATFGTLIWNLHSSGDGQVTFRIQRTDGPDHIETFNLDRNGENFFRIRAENDAMLVARFHTNVQLDDVRQPRMGGFGIVPEPSALAMLAIAGVGFCSSRKRKA